MLKASWFDLDRWLEDDRANGGGIVSLADRLLLPQDYGVYTLVWQEVPLYVGQTKNFRRRWTKHHMARDCAALPDLRILYRPISERYYEEFEKAEWVRIVNTRPLFQGGLFGDPKDVAETVADLVEFLNPTRGFHRIGKRYYTKTGPFGWYTDMYSEMYATEGVAK